MKSEDHRRDDVRRLLSDSHKTTAYGGIRIYSNTPYIPYLPVETVQR